MRFSTFLTAAATIVLAVSAQYPTFPDEATMFACQQCLLDAATAQVPACKGLDINPVNENDTVPDKKKTCLCGLASNSSWLTSCVKTDACSQANVDDTLPVYTAMKPTMCGSSAIVTGATGVSANVTGSASVSAGVTGAASATATVNGAVGSSSRAVGSTVAGAAAVAAVAGLL
ncbi:hypothetical protein BGX28_010531 [Mortierella sp. GBA30]|nr:hypothetical protein BGX28_010531 [Mortierella sp. GBA30]